MKKSIFLLLYIFTVQPVFGNNAVTLNRTKRKSGVKRICGRSYKNETVFQVLNLAPKEACIYRLLGSRFDEVEFFNAEFPIDCEKGQLWIYSKNREEGPFCRNSTKSREKRSADNENHERNLIGGKYNGDEIDVVIRNSGNEAIPISFGFNLGTRWYFLQVLAKKFIKKFVITVMINGNDTVNFAVAFSHALFETHIS